MKILEITRDIWQISSFWYTILSSGYLDSSWILAAGILLLYFSKKHWYRVEEINLDFINCCTSVIMTCVSVINFISFLLLNYMTFFEFFENLCSIQNWIERFLILCRWRHWIIFKRRCDFIFIFKFCVVIKFVNFKESIILTFLLYY